MEIKIEELETFEALWDWDKFCEGFTDGVSAVCNVVTVGMT